MKKRTLLTSVMILIFLNTNGQNSNEQYSVENTHLKKENSWAIGGGISNFIMHGDLRSLGTGNQGNFWNFGGYAYVDKMFNPLIGLELKANVSKISGGAQYFSDIYEVLYVDNTKINNNLFFEGNAYGAELNMILSFSNLYQKKISKLNISGYFGVGYHLYSSKLYERNPDESATLLIDFANNPARQNSRRASSIYLSTQLGIKYRINNKFDLEVRPSWYFNYEDHLDATISNKQDWETFFVTHIGLVFKLGKEKVYSIWSDDASKDTNILVVDTDKDGVIDELDIEPNTPEGAEVYGNGKAIDSDKDGLQDFEDECPLTKGSVSNKGCPEIKDTDNDGIPDHEDACLNTFGKSINKGCPVTQEKKEDYGLLINNINLTSGYIYFDSGQHEINEESFKVLDRISQLIKRLPKNIKFTVEGHTDNQNDRTFNEDLSKKRVLAVKKYLIKKGVNSERLIIKSYGETRPRFSNETLESRQLNRRVEIHPINFNDPK